MENTTPAMQTNEITEETALLQAEQQDEVIEEYDDDAELQARILELQLQMEAQWEAAGRMSAQEEEYARQAQEEQLYRESAQEVIDSYQARRKLLTASPIRSWRDTMYDDYCPPELSFWDKYGDRIITGLCMLVSFSIQIFLIIYYFIHR